MPKSSSGSGSNPYRPLLGGDGSDVGQRIDARRVDQSRRTLLLGARAVLDHTFYDLALLPVALVMIVVRKPAAAPAADA
jgi:hypothetical protein